MEPNWKMQWLGLKVLGLRFKCSWLHPARYNGGNFVTLWVCLLNWKRKVIKSTSKYWYSNYMIIRKLLTPSSINLELENRKDNTIVLSGQRAPTSPRGRFQLPSRCALPLPRPPPWSPSSPPAPHPASPLTPSPPLHPWQLLICDTFRTNIQDAEAQCFIPQHFLQPSSRPWELTPPKALL